MSISTMSFCSCFLIQFRFWCSANLGFFGVGAIAPQLGAIAPQCPPGYACDTACTVLVSHDNDNISE